MTNVSSTKALSMFEADLRKAIEVYHQVVSDMKEAYIDPPQMLAESMLKKVLTDHKPNLPPAKILQAKRIISEAVKDLNSSTSPANTIQTIKHQLFYKLAAFTTLAENEEHEYLEREVDPLLRQVEELAKLEQINKADEEDVLRFAICVIIGAILERQPLDKVGMYFLGRNEDLHAEVCRKIAQLHPTTASKLTSHFLDSEKLPQPAFLVEEAQVTKLTQVLLIPDFSHQFYLYVKSIQGETK